ncbi:MAG TPA: NAD-binding protein, partial [Thiolinea sp.]|nr:NAD-binding protein [Thiolinea sp.]
PRILDSSSALDLPAIPEHLLVIGGGIIGLEMATIYHALGSKITVVELSAGLIPGADRDLVRSLEKILRVRYAAIYTETQVSNIEPTPAGLLCSFSGKNAPAQQTFDYVLVATGRA